MRILLTHLIALNNYDTHPMEIEVNKLRLVEHSFKDFRDARILKTYEL